MSTDSLQVQEGSTVKAFHPGTLGVIYTGRVAKVGRKWLHVDFPLAGGVTRIARRDVVEVVSYLPQPEEVF